MASTAKLYRIVLVIVMEIGLRFYLTQEEQLVVAPTIAGIPRIAPRASSATASTGTVTCTARTTVASATLIATGHPAGRSAARRTAARATRCAAGRRIGMCDAVSQNR